MATASLRRKAFCPSGHALRGANLYRHGNKRYCRACKDSRRAADNERRRSGKEELKRLLVESEARWRADLPAIIALAEQQAVQNVR